MTYKRTDLAVEQTELCREEAQKETKIEGVSVQEEDRDGIRITRVTVENEAGSKALSKPVGTYITLETEHLSYEDKEQYMAMCGALKDELSKLAAVDRSRPVLVVGLGNRNITADALGPKTVEQMLVTRHLFEHMPEVVGTDTASVCAIAPGVLGITGIETMEIVKGVAEHVKPGLIIVIDALAARKVGRINTTIQISDTGISPGSGVGNNRKELSRATLGADVIAIGVPTVVDAVTMANDTLDITLSTIRAQAGEGAAILQLLEQLSPQEKYGLLQEALAPTIGDMVLTPKEVDLAMDKISKVVANGLNLTLQQGMSLEEIESFAL